MRRSADPRLVFFGMDSGFSAVLLQTLHRSGLTPRLVVVGTEDGEVMRRRPAQPSRLQLVLQKMRTGGVPDDDHPLVAVAHSLGVDAVVVSDAAARGLHTAVEAMSPDLFVVGSFPRLLPRRLLELSNLGGLNVHPGHLPAERGPAPLFWALKEGRPSIGYTIHMLDAGEDTGDVVASGELEFEPGTHGTEILVRCARAAAPLLVRGVRDLLAGEIVRCKQSRVGARRRPRPTFRDARIDTRNTAEQVFTYVAGCAGAYPVFAEVGGDRFFIADAVDYDLDEDIPFEFVLSGDRLILRCSPGVVQLRLRRDDGVIFSSEYTPEGDERDTR